LFSKSKLILSAFMTIIAVTILLVALPSPNTIITHRQQQEASATQGDTKMPTTDAACGQVVEGLVELNSDLDCRVDVGLPQQFLPAAHQQPPHILWHSNLQPWTQRSLLGPDSPAHSPK
jgi:hypothetical protein